MCRHSCYMSPRCVSLNIGPSKSPGKLLCQLNDADRYQHPQDFKDKPGFSYQGVLDNQCSTNPCSKHSACLHGYGDEYLCDCFPGWIGKNCSDGMKCFLK
ncbi:hypothetical protein AC249_AIPGENE4806 [Exaiptasia diaphana]|nr:hypothetical protein AC249_AIPGENE4806 [Exaiptasia diaphana]